MVFLNRTGETVARFRDGMVRHAENLTSHPRRSVRLEWIIIILIAIAIILYVMGIIRGNP